MVGAGAHPGVGVPILLGVGASASAMAGADIMAGVVYTLVGAAPLAGPDIMAVTGVTPPMAGAVIMAAAGDIPLMLYVERPDIPIWLPEMVKPLPGRPWPIAGLPQEI